MSNTQEHQCSVLCNRCGLSCELGSTGELGGLIRQMVVGGYSSTPGNGHGALDDIEGYRFSLCEFCLDWLFQTFKIPVELIANDIYPSGDAPQFVPAAQRVDSDEWRRMKAEFHAEHERRRIARQ